MGKIILTGDRPTGKLHLGHYIGSLRRNYNGMRYNHGFSDHLPLVLKLVFK